MPVPRSALKEHLHEVDKFYRCLTKVPYKAKLPATKFAYALEVIRPGRIFEIYTCPYCGYYHIGRKKKNRNASL